MHWQSDQTGCPAGHAAVFIRGTGTGFKRNETTLENCATGFKGGKRPKGAERAKGFKKRINGPLLPAHNCEI